MSRYDVAFFKFAIIFAISLNGIVGQLHEDLIIRVDIGIIFGILLRACSYVALCELVDFTIRGVKNYPQSNVELPIKI